MTSGDALSDAIRVVRPAGRVVHVGISGQEIDHFPAAMAAQRFLQKLK